MIFWAFSLNFRFFSFKTLPISPKEVEGKFSEFFLILRVRKICSFRLWMEGGKTLPVKGVKTHGAIKERSHRCIFKPEKGEKSEIFVQNGWLLSKGSEQRKSFSNFFCLGGSKSSSFFAYWWREAQNVPMERRLWMPWARTMPFPSAAFSI